MLGGRVLEGGKHQFPERQDTTARNRALCQAFPKSKLTRSRQATPEVRQIMEPHRRGEEEPDADRARSPPAGFFEASELVRQRRAREFFHGLPAENGHRRVRETTSPTATPSDAAAFRSRPPSWPRSSSRRWAETRRCRPEHDPERAQAAPGDLPAVNRRRCTGH